MKISQTLSLVLITLSVYGQKWHSKEYSTIDFSINYFNQYRSFSFDENDPVQRQYMVDRQFHEASSPAMGIGFAYSHGMSKRMLLSAGLSYTRFSFKSTDLLYSLEVDDFNNDILRMQTLSNNLSINYTFLSVPLKLRYIIAKQTCKSYLELGIQGHYYGRTQIQPKGQSALQASLFINENIDRFHASAVAAIGSEWAINEFFTAYTQLNVFSQLTSIRKHDIDERFSGIGLELGVRKFL